MECSFALVGKGYVLVAADMKVARSIVKMKSDEDKTKTLGPHLVMTYSGEPGDTVHFAEYIERNLRLHQIRHHHELRPSSAAAWIRRALADSLRSRSPYAVNLLVGGFDTSAAAIEEGKEELGGTPNLYWIDYLGTLAEVPFAAHGYGSYFVLSLLDRYHNPDATLEEGLATLKRCIDEVAKRLIDGVSNYKVKVVDKDGVREVSL
ncbi:20S proteasome subunit [Fomitiporia mediterranea MF3/22]|uniref:20S proteasome subunit n=1 Tax=Fomitiporia mediterranea (strain MF3/22) TaxID=694068 RepID=UPI0004407C49|nr:20S proteasome subunit [Fomitiporia mediterranea MF3/22]EJD00770.1 20S proteasome subunit [Fomitiporia mediterranea MF3/22]